MNKYNTQTNLDKLEHNIKMLDGKSFSEPQLKQLNQLADQLNEFAIWRQGFQKQFHTGQLPRSRKANQIK